MSKRTSVAISVGKGEIVSVELPSRNILPMPQRPRSRPLLDARSAICDAVAAAVGAPGIERRLRRSDARVCIVAPDRSRTMPVRETAEEFIEALTALGVSSSQIAIVLATGTHPPMGPAEIEAHVGPDLVSSVDVRNHDFRDEKRLVRVGGDLDLQGRALPVVINRDVFEADVVFGIGSVRPHRAVGWSGGAKIILPGVAGEETIELWHWLGWGFPREAIHWQVESPMRDIVELVGGRAGLDTVVNFVMNWQDEPLAVFGGHYVEVQRSAASIATRDYRIDVKERSDILILGSPAKSTTLYPSSAQLQQAQDLVKRGGTVILLSACADGIAPGLPQIGEFGYRPPEEVRALVEGGRLTSLVAASHIMYVSEGLFGNEMECILVSRCLGEDAAKGLGLSYATSAEEAIGRAFSRHGADASVRVVTHLAEQAERG